MRGMTTRRKYFFTDELVEETRLAYCGKKSELTSRLDRLVRRTGWPRWAFKYESGRRGWTTADHRRGWTAEEVEYLEERIGVVSVKQIAKRLGRTHQSVQAKAEKLHLSRRVREGYCLADLQVVFGESPHKVRRWVERGLLGKAHRRAGSLGTVRVTEANVVLFVRQHASEYDLRRVDQGWFKSMVFGSLADVRC